MRINTEITSEMFLSIMILFHDRLPCAENFFRYYKNYDKYIELNQKEKQKSPGSESTEQESFGLLSTGVKKGQNQHRWRQRARATRN